MSKDKRIKKIEEIYAIIIEEETTYNKAKAIYDAGFRDVGELWKWLEEYQKKPTTNDDEAALAIVIMNKLESL